jgi:hypothetical protein
VEYWRLFTWRACLIKSLLSEKEVEVMIVNLIPRHPSTNINRRSYSIAAQETEIITSNFLQSLDKEVRHNPFQAKKLRKTLTITHTMLVSTLVLAQPTYAAAMAPTNIDPDIVNTLVLLMLTCAGLGVLAAVVGLMAAGVWKMFFGGNQADQWRQNIYRGLGQVILAPVTVALIVGLALLLFSHIPAFQPLVKPIQAWFQM